MAQQQAAHDRSGRHAAVRQLAESMGMELPPLDLDQTLALTDPGDGGASDDGARCSDAGAGAPPPLSPASYAAAAAAAALRRPLPHALTEPPLRSPRQGELTLAGWNAAAGASGGGAPRPSSTDGMDAGRADYAEQVVALLEERDTLVDKLLETTQRLHVAEAKQREGEAAATQVHALLTQLQDLLRRAEAERDRAQRQLQQQALAARRAGGGQSLPPLPPLDTSSRRPSSTGPALSPEPSLTLPTFAHSDSGTPTAASLAALAKEAAVAGALLPGSSPTRSGSPRAKAAQAAAAAAAAAAAPAPAAAGAGGGKAGVGSKGGKHGSELRHRKPAAGAAAAADAGAAAGKAAAPKPGAAAAEKAAAPAAREPAAAGRSWAPLLVALALVLGLAVGAAVAYALLSSQEQQQQQLEGQGSQQLQQQQYVRTLEEKLRRLEAELKRSCSCGGGGQ